jgi:hypothetical protein
VLQFSSKGTAGGLVANVDINAFRGSREELTALTTAGDDMDPELAAALKSFLLGYDGARPTGSSWASKGLEAPLRQILTALADLKAAVGQPTVEQAAAVVDPVALATALAGNPAFVKNLATAMVEQLPAEVGRRLING